MKKSLIYITLILISAYFFNACKTDPNSNFINGCIKYDHEDYPGALQELNKAIELYPNNSGYLCTRLCKICSKRL